LRFGVVTAVIGCEQPESRRSRTRAPGRFQPAGGRVCERACRDETTASDRAVRQLQTPVGQTAHLSCGGGADGSRCERL